MSQFIRSEMLLGKNAIEKLNDSTVAVFGIGGVGSYVCEALARTGVGSLVFIDSDTVQPSNINRQIIALHSTVGKSKTEVMKERVLDINPDIKVKTYDIFYTPETAHSIDYTEFDYVVDAIDTVTGKIHIIKTAYDLGIPVISSMGTGNKLDPTRLMVSDISKTHTCPLARVMRRELGKLGIKHMKVLWSDETPAKPICNTTENKQPPASVAFVPSVAGLIIAGEVIKDITKE